MVSGGMSFWFADAIFLLCPYVAFPVCVHGLEGKREREREREREIERES